MARKLRVKLDCENMKAFGMMFKCCDVRQWIPNELECGEQWDCDVCEKPIVFRAWSGQWHHVGEKVFD